jgi:hypothetical protein
MGTPEEDWYGFFDADDNFTGQELTGLVQSPAQTYYLLEREPGPRHHYMVRDGKYSVTRTLMIRGADLQNFLADFGGGYDWGVQVPCTTYLPASYPGLPWLVVSDIVADPINGGLMLGWDDEGEAVIPFYIIVMLYETKEFMTHEDDPVIPVGTMLTMNLDMSSSAVLVPRAALAWAPVNPESPYLQPLQEDVTVTSFEPSATLHLMWKWVPIPNWAFLADAIGCINDDLFFNYHSETVMYVGCTAECTFTVNAIKPLWKITFTLMIKQVNINLVEASGAIVRGWNHLLNPSPQTSPNSAVERPQYQEVVYANTSEGLFPRVDMMRLFYVGPIESFDAQIAEVGGEQSNENITIVVNEPDLLN